MCGIYHDVAAVCYAMEQGEEKGFIVQNCVAVDTPDTTIFRTHPFPTTTSHLHLTLMNRLQTKTAYVPVLKEYIL